MVKKKKQKDAFKEFRFNKEFQYQFLYNYNIIFFVQLQYQFFTLYNILVGHSVYYKL